MPLTHGEVRWGIVGTANIARAQFLPGLREAGGGRAVLVASRDRARAAGLRRRQRRRRGDRGLRRAGRVARGRRRVRGPAQLAARRVDDPGAAGGQGRALREAAVRRRRPDDGGARRGRRRAPARRCGRRSSSRSRPSTSAWLSLLADGAVGDLAELVSAFHFRLPSPANIRLLGRARRRRAGRRRLLPDPAGATSCSAPTRRRSRSGPRSSPTGGEVESRRGRASSPPATRRLVLTCGFKRSYDTFTRVLGERGPAAPDQPVPPRPGRHPHPAAGPGPTRSSSTRPPTSGRSPRPCAISTPCCAARRSPSTPRRSSALATARDPGGRAGRRRAGGERRSGR